jgi:hypothetical protein
MAIPKIAPITLAQKSLSIIDGAIATTDGLYRVETISLRQVKQLIAESPQVETVFDDDGLQDAISQQLGSDTASKVGASYRTWVQQVGETALAFTLQPLNSDDAFVISPAVWPATWQLVARVE